MAADGFAAKSTGFSGVVVIFGAPPNSYCKGVDVVIAVLRQIEKQIREEMRIVVAEVGRENVRFGSQVSDRIHVSFPFCYTILIVKSDLQQIRNA